MSTALTIDQFKAVLPPQVKKGVNQELIDTINNTLSNPEMMEQYRDNLLSYTTVLTQGKFKIQSYLDSVRYVSFKLLGGTNLQAYVKTFPDKYQRFLGDGISAKDIASYVSAFNKSKLVNLIWAQSMIPTHVLNQDVFQRAINIQAELMADPDVSPKVRSDAANSLLTHLKAPEVKKIELDIGVKESSVIDDLRQATMRLTEQHRLQIASGASTVKEVAHSTIIDATFKEVIDE